MTDFPYEDIVSLPHHVSERHAHMTMLERAGQFSPFAALSGYGAAVSETARLTDTFREPDEEQAEALNRALTQLKDTIGEHPAVTITYFEWDARKEGGCYRTVTANAVRIDPAGRTITLEGGDELSFDVIAELTIIHRDFTMD